MYRCENSRKTPSPRQREGAANVPYQSNPDGAQELLA